jgi:hypothetical protein
VTNRHVQNESVTVGFGVVILRPATLTVMLQFSTLATLLIGSMCSTGRGFLGEGPEWCIRMSALVLPGICIARCLMTPIESGH